MATRTQIYREVLREMDALRTRKAAELRERKDMLYERLPLLAEIETELSLLGTRTARLTLTHPGNVAGVLAEMKTAQKALLLQREQILAENNWSLKLLEIEHDCPRCQDTGYVEQEPCICMKRRLMDKMYDQSNVRHIIEVENFDNFDFKLYSNQPAPGERLSSKENAEKVFKRARRFVDNFGDGSNLMLYGGTGLGKTFLCNCIAKDLLKKGHTVLYLTAGQLFRKLEEQRFHRDDEEEAKDWDQELLEAELLIVDDLGTEFATMFTTSELFRIVNDRKLSQRSVVISTNLNPTQLMEHYSERVTSRLVGDYEQLKFYGEDIRIIKKYQ